MSGVENIKAKDDYVLSYNRRLRLANWVAEVSWFTHHNVTLSVCSPGTSFQYCCLGRKS